MAAEAEGLAINEKRVFAVFVLDRVVVAPREQFLLHHVTHPARLQIRLIAQFKRRKATQPGMSVLLMMASAILRGPESAAAARTSAPARALRPASRPWRCVCQSRWFAKLAQAMTGTRPVMPIKREGDA